GPGSVVVPHPDGLVPAAAGDRPAVTGYGHGSHGVGVSTESAGDPPPRHVPELHGPVTAPANQELAVLAAAHAGHTVFVLTQLPTLVRRLPVKEVPLPATLRLGQLHEGSPCSVRVPPLEQLSDAQKVPGG